MTSALVACARSDDTRARADSPLGAPKPLTAAASIGGAPLTAASMRRAPLTPPRLPPLTDATWLESLTLPDGRVAFVSVPLGATEPRPVMVGIHGAGDRPEWACGGYRAVTNAFPFIVCPRGLSHGGQPEKFWSPGAERIEKDVANAIVALRARFGSHVAEGPLLYAGFSLGAMQGAKVLADEPELFSEALLVEGGFTELTPVVAGAWSKAGGKRALLACGIASCPSEWSRAEKALRQAGIESRVLDARTGRHNLDGEMMKALRAAFPWLVRDDPRWSAFVAARDAGALGQTPGWAVPTSGAHPSPRNPEHCARWQQMGAAEKGLFSSGFARSPSGARIAQDGLSCHRSKRNGVPCARVQS